MAPVQFTYSLMTRSLRVSHASVARRDPHLARGVERLLAASVGVASDPPPPPTALPFALGDRRARSRIAVTGGRTAPPLVALGGAALAGAGCVVTSGLAIDAAEPRGQSLADDAAAVAWRRVVDAVHDHGALIIARLELRPELRPGLHPGLHQDLPHAPHAALLASVQRAGVAGFDVVLLDPCGDPAAIEELPSAVAAARTAWRAGGWIAAAIHDRPGTRAAVIGHAAQVVRAGADLLWVSAPTDSPLTHGARLPAAPLADRLRNELGVATAIEAGDALLPDLDAAIAAGRADLIVTGRLLDGARRAP
jgi:anthraniloyl-CoA monooxygenase